MSSSSAGGVRPYKPLLPAPPQAQQGDDAAGQGGSGFSPGSGPGSSKRKRTNVQVACNMCRVKKTACDGYRPVCHACAKRRSECIYAVPETEGLKKETAFLKQKRDEASGLLALLSSLPEDEAIRVLQRLQALASPAAVLHSLGHSSHLPEGQVARAVSPPTQTGTEFELMVRHPILYPTLVPLDAAYIHSSILRNPGRGVRRVSAFDPHYTSPLGTRFSPSATPTPPDGASSGSSTGASSGRLTLSRHGSGSPGSLALPSTQGPARPPRYADDRLLTICIGDWTRIPVTDQFAARVLSLYLKTDHPLLALFDADLFLTDFIDNRPRFCSPLLVSSLLCWACQAYSSFDVEAAVLSLAFYDEANRLWWQEVSPQHSSDGGATDSLNTVAASQLLSLAASGQGRDQESAVYLDEGVSMGVRMGLFGDGKTQARMTWGPETPFEWRRAAAHTAWGVFCWVTLHSLHFQKGKIQTAPRLAIPGNGDNHFDTGEVDGHLPSEHFPLPSYMGNTFTKSCKFWSIVHNMIWPYYNEEGGPLPDRVSLSVAEETYQKLLAWGDNLPLDLTRGDSNQHHEVVFHIFYHCAILDLFRPFLQHRDQHELSSFAASGSSPQAVFAASVNQLKRLVLVYRDRFPASRYSILWHTGLLYVANAVLRAAPDVDADWRFYFGVCIACYSRLYASFRLVEGVVKGLLAMAMRRGLLGGAEAERLLAGMRERGAHYTVGDDVRASFKLDLDLAMTDPDAAQVGILAARFDELAMWNVFTTGPGEEDGSGPDVTVT